MGRSTDRTGPDARARGGTVRRPTCVARLALRRLVTAENIIIAGMVLGTAAAVGVTAWVGAVVLRLL